MTTSPHPFSVDASPGETRQWHDTHYRTTTPEESPGKWEQFENVPDPYNSNTMSGHVNRRSGDEYGTLIVTHVNGEPAPQRIAGTPKASYPYSHYREWLLRSADSIQTYIKYDGTSICQYSYADAQDRRYTSFKLRARPFIPPRFETLLARTLDRYPAVAGLKLEEGEALLYELYGSHNPILIQYDTAIDLVALCRREPNAGDLIPADPGDPVFAQLDCPLAQPTPAASWLNIRAEYISRQTLHSSNLVQTEFDGEKMFRGEEGEMLYATFPDGDRSLPGAFTRMIKLKPPEIEEVHQALQHVPRAELEATVRNIFEAADDPTINDFVMLLSEEWEDDQIRRSMDTAERVLAETLTRHRFQEGVLNTYFEHFTPDDLHQKRREVMTAMGKVYHRVDMQRVFAVLAERMLPPPDQKSKQTRRRAAKDRKVTSIR